MKFAGAIVALILSASVFSQDYKVTRFEASDYRSFTLDELSTMIGDNNYLLPLLKCNGRDELDPFQAPHRMNPLRNSLKIKVPKEETYYTYQLGRYFDRNGSEVTRFSDPFMKRVSKALARFEKLESTSKLLRHLEESYFPLTLTLGGNSFSPTVEGGKNWSGIKQAQAIAYFTTLRMSPGGFFADIGVGGKILWNPELKIETIEDDGVKRPLDTDVALAHEMYHAFDSIRGTLDMGFVVGENYSFDSVVEYRGVYFENLVRHELGIRYRKYYSDPYQENLPDLLDDEGEPIYIPAPCL